MTLWALRIAILGRGRGASSATKSILSDSAIHPGKDIWQVTNSASSFLLFTSFVIQRLCPGPRPPPVGLLWVWTSRPTILFRRWDWCLSAG